MFLWESAGVKKWILYALAERLCWESAGKLLGWKPDTEKLDILENPVTVMT